MQLKENLSRLIHSIQEDPNYDIEEVRELVSDTSGPDIRDASKLFIQLCHLITDTLVRTRRAVTGISLLSDAIMKLQQSGSQLTPLHSDFCLLCLEAKCFNPALVYLEIDYTEIKIEQRNEDTKQVVLFYYYGGLIYSAIKNFERASFCFEVVLTIPASVMTPIMQEIYKKYILTTLLVHGKLPEPLLPKYTSQSVTRHRKHLDQPYIKFAQEYATQVPEKVRRVITSNRSIFERDENLGLIKQCLAQLYKRNIQRLTKTFLTLPLRDVANYVGLANESEAESYILNMIDDGDISATINQLDGMVAFEDNTEKYDTVSIFQKLQEDMVLSTNLIEILRKLDTDTADHKRAL